MANTFSAQNELNYPDLKNYQLRLPFAFHLKRGDGAPANDAKDHFRETVVLEELQDYTVDEPFAVTVTPTHDDGKHITHRGSVFKEITFAGTTGFMAKRARGVDAVKTNKRTLPPPGQGTVFDPWDPDLSLSGALKITPLITQSLDMNPKQGEQFRKDNSGFIKFVRLRNLFREYARIKKTASSTAAHDTMMYFYDMKLEEWWLIEPTFFKMSRTKGSPFTFSYQIHVRTIRPGFQPKDTLFLPEDKEDKPLIAQMGHRRNTERLLKAFEYLLKLRDIIREVTAKFAGMIRNVFELMLVPLDEITAWMGTIADVTDTLKQIPSGLMKRFNNSMQGALNQMERLDDMPRDVKELGNELAIEARQIMEGIAAHYEEVIYGPSNIGVLRAAGQMYTNANAPAEAARADAYNVWLTQRGLDNVLQNTLDRYNSTKVATILDGESIFDVARRTTESVHTVPLIVALNNLQFPYIVGFGEASKSGTLRAGDQILLPTEAANAATGAVAQAMELTPTLLGSVVSATASVVTVDQTSLDDSLIGFTLTVTDEDGAAQSAVIIDNAATLSGSQLTLDHDLSPIPNSTYTYKVQLVQRRRSNLLSPLDAKYGIDAQLQERPGGLLDATLGSDGDINLHVGLPNMFQAIRLVLGTSRGQNVANNFYGIEELAVGTKATEEKLVSINFAAREALSIDTRIESLNKLNVYLIGDAVYLNINLTPVGGKPENYDVPLMFLT